MVDPLYQPKEKIDATKNVNPMNYFDTELHSDKSGFEEESKQTLVPISVIKQLIHDYKRLKKFEKSFKASKLSVKK